MKGMFPALPSFRGCDANYTSFPLLSHIAILVPLTLFRGGHSAQKRPCSDSVKSRSSPLEKYGWYDADGGYEGRDDACRAVQTNIFDHRRTPVGNTVLSKNSLSDQSQHSGAWRLTRKDR